MLFYVRKQRAQWTTMREEIVNPRFEDGIKHAFILVIEGDIFSNNCAFEKMGGSILKKEIAGIFSKNDKSI